MVNILFSFRVPRTSELLSTNDNDWGENFYTYSFQCLTNISRWFSSRHQAFNCGRMPGDSAQKHIIIAFMETSITETTWESTPHRLFSSPSIERMKWCIQSRLLIMIPQIFPPCSSHPASNSKLAKNTCSFIATLRDGIYSCCMKRDLKNTSRYWSTLCGWR
jgi:hypothetical protein